MYLQVITSLNNVKVVNKDHANKRKQYATLQSVTPHKEYNTQTAYCCILL